MSELWIGTRDGLVDAARSVGISLASDTRLLTDGAFEARAFARWCGIEPLPPEAHIFTLRAPNEGSGTARWVHYDHPTGPMGYAPEVDLYVLRVGPE